MDHRDHVGLLKPAHLTSGGIWADLGAGGGAFTLALRELIGPNATIHAVDKDKSSLRELERAYGARFGSTENLILLPKDFSRPLDLPPLDGVVAANSIHFFKDREKILRQIHALLKPGGILLLIEYNTDSGNPWVPHPFSSETFRKLATSSGFMQTHMLGGHPSRFLREIYSAVTYKQKEV
jgi:ubiquinone/menaquinone biosynthesis C-methylase UbiE